MECVLKKKDALKYQSENNLLMNKVSKSLHKKFINQLEETQKIYSKIDSIYSQITLP